MRGTIWEIILYKDDALYNEVIKKLEEYEYAKITHNLDVNDDGTIKKEHTHIVIKTSQISLSTLAQHLQIKENYIAIKRNLKFAVRYLWHKDQPLKHQYPYEAVETNNKKWLDWYGEGEISARTVIEAMEENRPQTFRELCYMLSDLGLFGTFRQAQTLFLEVWKEIKNERKYYNKK